MPTKSHFNVRGTAIGEPGEFHDTLIHNNFTETPMPDHLFVSNEDALAYKEYMNG